MQPTCTKIYPPFCYTSQKQKEHIGSKNSHRHICWRYRSWEKPPGKPRQGPAVTRPRIQWPACDQAIRTPPGFLHQGETQFFNTGGTNNRKTQMDGRKKWGYPSCYLMLFILYGFCVCVIVCLGVLFCCFALDHHHPKWSAWLDVTMIKLRWL